jgi:hypothetical protein
MQARTFLQDRLQNVAGPVGGIPRSGDGLTKPFLDRGRLDRTQEVASPSPQPAPPRFSDPRSLHEAWGHACRSAVAHYA